jgi:hypothetical protein
MDEEKLQKLVGQMLNDLGGAASEKPSRLGGFRNIRRATATPFNMVLEARP